MILEDATFEAFGYYPSDLSHGSGNRILAICELCGAPRAISKNDYRTFCFSCSHMLGAARKGETHFNFGRTHSETTKAKMSKANKGRIPWNKGETLSEETRTKITGENNHNFGKRGEETSQWRGGPIECKCKICGNIFFIALSEVKKGGGNYCSHVCCGKAHLGKKNSFWRGGPKLSNRRAYAKRRSLGFIPINAPFKSAEGHHLTHNVVAFIPAWTHQAIRHNMHTGRNMLKVNESALSFLLEGF